MITEFEAKKKYCAIGKKLDKQLNEKIKVITNELDKKLDEIDLEYGELIEEQENIFEEKDNKAYEDYMNVIDYWRLERDKKAAKKLLKVKKGKK